MAKYRAIPQGFMTVGEVAKKMGVTVRTLQYYDKEGLLSPSAESEGGRRLYTDKDLITLHQIISLKSLGFSLDDIKERLISLETPADVANALTEQADDIRQKIEQLQASLSAIEQLKAEVLQMQTVNFKKYADRRARSPRCQIRARRPFHGRRPRRCRWHPGTASAAGQISPACRWYSHRRPCRPRS